MLLEILQQRRAVSDMNTTTVIDNVVLRICLRLAIGKHMNSIYMQSAVICSRHLECFHRCVKAAKGVLCRTETAKRLRPLRCEVHAPLRVFQGLALGISELQVGRTAVAIVNLIGSRHNVDTRENTVC